MNCKTCGFGIGDRVKMESGLTKADGGTIGWVHGTVEAWEHGCHIVEWTETGCVTALPNPYVSLVAKLLK
jgi:hypothetical protein